MSRKGVSNGWAEKPPLPIEERIVQLIATIERTPRRNKRLIAEYRDGLHQLLKRRYAVQSWEAGREQS